MRVNTYTRVVFLSTLSPSAFSPRDTVSAPLPVSRGFRPSVFTSRRSSFTRIPLVFTRQRDGGRSHSDPSPRSFGWRKKDRPEEEEKKNEKRKEQKERERNARGRRKGKGGARQKCAKGSEPEEIKHFGGAGVGGGAEAEGHNFRSFCDRISWKQCALGTAIPDATDPENTAGITGM